ncbi:unnamed protein product [Vitrella brassicaformis CCMP3155]|uniref:Uncharacterized protein n=1 Tax=Vitrella brassicaformis (strain CCMP3155) TaxID=1169540 RepID=A0A0G4FR75_VITBC|nr:unnamed protein product [Vitrella brassicaformis CCMP3155]|eukprot:CEM17009.1 unnamed protein product [Vitrella brassicaformis CCMP3155]
MQEGLPQQGRSHLLAWPTPIAEDSWVWVAMTAHSGPSCRLGKDPERRAAADQQWPPHQLRRHDECPMLVLAAGEREHMGLQRGKPEHRVQAPSSGRTLGAWSRRRPTTDLVHLPAARQELLPSVRPETLQLPSETLLSFDEPPPLSSSRRRRLTHPDSLPAATFRVTDRKTNASRWRTIWRVRAALGHFVGWATTKTVSNREVVGEWRQGPDGQLVHVPQLQCFAVKGFNNEEGNDDCQFQWGRLGSSGCRWASSD